MRRLKAEWEKQEAILLAFPHQESDWDYCIEDVRENFCTIIEAILPIQKVIVCLDPKDQMGEKILKQKFKENKQLIIVKTKLNDTWIRDFGPISVEEDKKIQLFDFFFNGWGLKFASNWDNQVTQNLFLKGIIQKPEIQDMVLEGGSIDTDGQGTLLTTTQCLLEKNRNPHLTQKEIEDRLKNLFGCHRIFWLNHGFLAGDDTDSHIDTLARFLDEKTIAYVSCKDQNDIHYEELMKMEEELRSFRTIDNKPYELIPLPLPNIKESDFTHNMSDQEHRLPASYANFLITNSHLLLPTYGVDELDLEAIRALEKFYPVIPIDCRTLIRQHGSLHCVSMQLYAL